MTLAPTLSREKVEWRAPVLRSHTPRQLRVIVTATPRVSHGMMERIWFLCLGRGKTSSTMVVMSHTLMVLSMEEVTAWFHFPSMSEVILIWFTSD